MLVFNGLTNNGDATMNDTNFTIGQTVRFYSVDGRPDKHQTTITHIGEDGWVYGMDGSAAPASQVKAEEKISCTGAGTWNWGF